MTRQELATHLNVTISDIERNFPKLAVKQMTQGIEIKRSGKGKDTVYTLVPVEPRQVDTSYFSLRPKDTTVINNEAWTTCIPYPDYEVSDQGRIRHKTLQWIQKPEIQDGYARASIRTNGKSMRVLLHRLILQSFDPQENWNELSVDHINGIRSDNRLVNLRWLTQEENIGALCAHRAELNVELTRIINKLGYEGTLKLLQTL